MLYDFSYEELCIDVDFSPPSDQVVRSLTRIIERRGKPKIIRAEMGIHFQYIQPGKPQQDAYIERYNRAVRHEWLDQNIVETIEEAQEQTTKWLWTYNYGRPDMAIGRITPAMKLKVAA